MKWISTYLFTVASPAFIMTELSRFPRRDPGLNRNQESAIVTIYTETGNITMETMRKITVSDR